MIRRCDLTETEIIFTIINDASQAYKGIIPVDRWKEPYMTKEKLLHEIEGGIEFWGLPHVLGIGKKDNPHCKDIYKEQDFKSYKNS